MEKTIFVENLEATLSLGKKLGELLQPGMLITLDGDLGAGKTTFTKGIGQGLQIKRVINSPTFTILKQYRGRLQLSHFDAYRLEGENEELGFEEMFEDGGVCVIEWPMYIQDILPDNRLEIHMTKNKDQTRHMTFVAHGQQYQQLLKEMNICCN